LAYRFILMVHWLHKYTLFVHFFLLTECNFLCDTKLIFNINECQGIWVWITSRRIWNVLICVLEHGNTLPLCCSLHRISLAYLTTRIWCVNSVRNIMAMAHYACARIWKRTNSSRGWGKQYETWGWYPVCQDTLRFVVQYRFWLFYGNLIVFWFLIIKLNKFVA
jgi:hypothetical protein